VTDTQL